MQSIFKLSKRTYLIAETTLNTISQRSYIKTACKFKSQAAPQYANQANQYRIKPAYDTKVCSQLSDESADLSVRGHYTHKSQVYSKDTSFLYN